jgi:hypothetical protein
MLFPFRPNDRNLPPLPARLLRRILIDGNHTIGQHVLIAGDHCGEMAEWLDELGFDVEAIDDSKERLSARQTSGAKFEIHFAKLDGTDDLGDNPFDLIIADELNLHRDNLLGLPARLATAELLAQLKSEGELVVVREPGNLGHHDVACWTRHLACFPGRLETFEYPTPLFSREMYQWLVRGVRPEPFLTVSLKIPAERLSLTEWCEHARRGLLTSSASCCAVKTFSLPSHAA